MPEGHTIHALAQRLTRRFAGEEVASSSPQGRFAAEAALLDGRELIGAQAAGKHLFVEFTGDAVVHVHLGLIGLFPVVPYAGDVPPPPVGAVRWRLAGAGHVADLRGPNMCRLADHAEIETVLAKLGPDPLRPDADPERAWAKIRRSRKSIAELLMDQSVLAGVGNVYRAEVLFHERIDPATPGRELPEEAWRRIWGDLVDWLPLGVRYGQILTLPEQVAAARAAYDTAEVIEAYETHTGEKLGGRYGREFAVYKRTGEPCLECGTPVQASDLAGRVLYWCPTCQRAG